MAHLQLLPQKYPTQDWEIKEHSDSIKEPTRKFIHSNTVSHQCRKKQYAERQEEGVKIMNPHLLIPLGIMWEDKYGLDQVQTHN